MIYKGYIGEAVFDEEERTIRGRVVNLRRDGINFESEHASRVEDEFRASVDEYLGFCREQNREPEAPHDSGATLTLLPEQTIRNRAEPNRSAEQKKAG